MREQLMNLYFWLAAVCVASNIYFLIPIYSSLAKGPYPLHMKKLFSRALSSPFVMLLVS
ncbi:MAG TPA: hypothetical protein VEY70_27345 [Metabacillus sp.]|nr:hypothetical protein [Metabacillus sp.]